MAFTATASTKCRNSHSGASTGAFSRHSPTVSVSPAKSRGARGDGGCGHGRGAPELLACHPRRSPRAPNGSTPAGPPRTRPPRDISTSAAIIAFTESGQTARLISALRRRSRIIALTPHPVIVRRMRQYWGVSGHVTPSITSTDGLIQAAPRLCAQQSRGRRSWSWPARRSGNKATRT